MQAVFAHRRHAVAGRPASGDRPAAAGRSAVQVDYGLTAATDPFRLRLELRRSRGSAMPEPDLVVDDGDAVWEVQDGTVGHRTYRAVSPGPAQNAVDLLLPRALGAGIRLSPTAAYERDGRVLWRVRADPPPGRLPPTGGPFGHAGSSGELEVDAATGIVLSALWRDRDGSPVESAALTGLVVDAGVEDALFRYQPPPGVTVQEGFGGRLPARFGPAVVLGVLTAAAGEGLARLLGRPSTGGRVTWGG